MHATARPAVIDGDRPPDATSASSYALCAPPPGPISLLTSPIVSRAPLGLGRAWMQNSYTTCRSWAMCVTRAGFPLLPDQARRDDGACASDRVVGSSVEDGRGAARGCSCASVHSAGKCVSVIVRWWRSRWWSGSRCAIRFLVSGAVIPAPRLDKDISLPVPVCPTTWIAPSSSRQVSLPYRPSPYVARQPDLSGLPLFEGHLPSSCHPSCRSMCIVYLHHHFIIIAKCDVPGYLAPLPVDLTSLGFITITVFTISHVPVLSALVPASRSRLRD
ncbi:uncharacterized protein C8Q71DRAFT_181469 [Rhodofomes roseus]|uniref:Uncharacterized protein n=1 Tax=Rhodofomes roseus TaxID=34475 RepID=A0ABQ8K7Z5_9APHY|nr:uncharacterized protein C8Q71DRAFT_181469 [Rhodofomes roseus]KAH9833407.1 hypothetical protein C8Q71DRAFT_181469 [Rhodofomes roseus]